MGFGDDDFPIIPEPSVPRPRSNVAFYDTEVPAKPKKPKIVMVSDLPASKAELLALIRAEKDDLFDNDTVYQELKKHWLATHRGREDPITKKLLGIP